MQLPRLPLVVLDTETTGFVPRVHRIIEFACVVAEGGEVTVKYEQLFSGKDEVPPHVQVLTRIRPDDLKGKPTFAEKKEEMTALFPKDAVFVGQNLGFDIGMLKGEGIDLSERPWIDTSVLAALVFPELRSFSLQYMSAALNLDHSPAHRAMGDVRATLELLGRVWERLEELPPEQSHLVKRIMERSTPGYRALAAVLESKGKTPPAWIKRAERSFTTPPAAPVALEPPAKGTVALHEEGLDASSLQTVVDAAAHNPASRHWIAVKNLEGALRRLRLPATAQVLYPPSLLLDPEAAKRLLAQEVFTAEEATLAIKLQWFRPVHRADMPVHAGERDVWNGKLACTDASPAYAAQFQSDARVFLLDHRQLLSFLGDVEHSSHGALGKDAHVIIDDASMLEDTATKAYGHYCGLDDLRAAAQGDEALTSLADVAMLWAEKIRHGEDSHLIVPADLSRPETKGMREQIAHFLSQHELPQRTRHQLKELQGVLDKDTLQGDIRWIEARLGGSIHLHAAPERVDTLLEQSLYERFPTTLLIPAGGDAMLPEILPKTMKAVRAENIPASDCKIPIAFPPPLDGDVASLLKNPPSGRTIVLAQSKRVIEQFFVQYTEALEDKGIALICQGLGGGQGRMESDFLAEKNAVWLLTPWMYEGVELPDDTVDHLVLDCLPFDHPGHPVFARRKNHYRDSFAQYALPHVQHRLFRILRTFCRHRTKQSDVKLIDKRLHEKAYGATIMNYVKKFADDAMPAATAPVRQAKAKGDDAQLKMF